MQRMPVLFVGHGSPMNAIEDTPWSRGFRALGGLLPQPKAVLCISAHWYVEGTFLTGEQRPRTIHDFGGFPQELYEIQYPARGDPTLAARVAHLAGASLSNDWGLDHGTWSVLLHMRPAADVPVVQLSIDARLRPEEHLQLGRALRPLRDEGVLILGSGNLTHNLRHAFTAWHRGDTSTPDWAAQFDAEAKQAAEQRDHAALARLPLTPHGRMSHPTPDHYYPLLYAAGASDERDTASFPIEGYDMGSLSMRAILFQTAAIS
jgi:4,5-DOPA dioxygenase extradiol